MFFTVRNSINLHLYRGSHILYVIQTVPILQHVYCMTITLQIDLDISQKIELFSFTKFFVMYSILKGTVPNISIIENKI